MIFTIVIATMVSSAFLMTLAHAADTGHQKSHPQMEQKQADKDVQKNNRVIPGGSVGDERTWGPSTSGTGGAGNVTVPQHQGAKKKP
jgi:hypothetical protein